MLHRHPSLLGISWVVFASFACSGEEEPPTEEQLLAEKLGRLVEADGEQGGKVTDQELSLWENMFLKWKEEKDPEVYAQWKECMEHAEQFKAAEACANIIDPQDTKETLETPKTVDDVCTRVRELATSEGRAHEPQMSMDYCRRDMKRLNDAMAGNWNVFGKCATEATDLRIYDGCQFDALPSPADHCSRISAIRTEWEEPLPNNYLSICNSEIESKRAKLNRLENRIDLSCCLNFAQSPTDIDTCLNSPSPACKAD